MTLYGLTGKKLNHSFSAEYFNKKFKILNIDARYDLLPLNDINNLPDLINKNPELKGLNVTIPYKESVIPFLDEKDITVEETGACNTIKITDGKLKGYNTDIIGFANLLIDFTGKERPEALILGYGGAAKAVVYVLKKMGVSYKIVSRSKEKGDLLWQELTPQIVENHRLIINTTPLGMYPDTEAAPALPYNAVGSSHYACDLIYNPAETMFLKHCRLNNARTVNGLKMLYAQAEAAFSIWNE